MTEPADQPQRPSTDAFCITCGGPDPVADGQCLTCLTEGLEVARGPDEPVRIEICRHCGATPIKSQWKEPPSRLELVEQRAIGSVRVPEELEDVRLGVRTERHTEDNFTVVVEIEGGYKGVQVGGVAEVEVQVKGAVCPACSRRHGGYFEAIVQVRAEGDRPVSDQEAGDIAEIIEEEVSRAGGIAGGQGYLLKAEAMHGGYDYYFGTMNVARSIVRRLIDKYGARTKDTITTVGRKDGKDVNRLTISVRIPEATPGSYLGLDEEVVQVIGRRGNRLLTRTVPDREKRLLEERDVELADLLEPKVLDVIYAEAGEGQVMDPETYKTIEVRLPEGVGMGDQVRAVKHEGDWTVVGRA